MNKVHLQPIYSFTENSLPNIRGLTLKNINYIFKRRYIFDKEARKQAN